MSEPSYWKTLNWSNGWDPSPTVVAVAESNSVDGSKTIVNGSDRRRAIPLPEQDLSEAMAENGSYDTAWLPTDGDIFGRIAKYLKANAAARRLAPPTGERTRMQRAQTNLDELIGKDALTANEEAQLKTHLQTIRESLSKYRKPAYIPLFEKYNIPQTRQNPPRSGDVEITKIKVIRHKVLWQRFLSGRDRIRKDIDYTADIYRRVERDVQALQASGIPVVSSTTPKALSTGSKWGGRDMLAFTTVSDEGLVSNNQKLPVLDKETGEALLMHGTLPNVIKIICDAGFDPKFSKGRVKNGATKYGALGQGTYFGDSFAKIQTYTGCPVCSALVCNCVDQNGVPVDRMIILARCLLGVSTKARTHDSHRKDSASKIKSGKHSVYGQSGSFTGRWSAFGSNEFLIKQRDQMYPEFIVYWRRAG